MRDEPILILTPVFDDWAALGALLGRLDAVLAAAGLMAEVLVVDDGSAMPADSLRAPILHALRQVHVLRLRRNVGHQRAIALGLAYVEANVPCRAVVVMDSDGEDDPADVPRLLARCEAEGFRKVVFAERQKRSESWLFRVFYLLYRLLYRLLCGQPVRVGNFSVVPRENLRSLVAVSELWNHYAAAVYKSRQPCCAVPTRRARRLDGRSQMNFVSLIVHGLSAISVHADTVGVRLLIASTALIAASGLGLAGVVAVRLLTSLAIPGWATSAAGLLLVLLLQFVLFSIVFCFITLSSRQGTTVLPLRDYPYFVADVRRVYAVAEGESRIAAATPTAGLPCVDGPAVTPDAPVSTW